MGVFLSAGRAQRLFATLVGHAGTYRCVPGTRTQLQVGGSVHDGECGHGCGCANVVPSRQSAFARADGGSTCGCACCVSRCRTACRVHADVCRSFPGVVPARRRRVVYELALPANAQGQLHARHICRCRTWFDGAYQAPKHARRCVAFAFTLVSNGQYAATDHAVPLHGREQRVDHDSRAKRG